MKKVLMACVVSLVALNAQAAVVVDPYFGAIDAGGIMTQALNHRMKSTINLDKGWVAQERWANKTSAGLQIGSSEFRDPAGANYSFGQMNTDNKLTTGIIQFKIVIGEFSNWDADDRAVFQIDVFGCNGKLSGFDQIGLNPMFTGLTLPNLATNGNFTAGWSHIGSVQTAQIDGTKTGDFVTGEVDLGSGWDLIAFRVSPIDVSGTIALQDMLYITKIEIFPEPVTVGMRDCVRFFLPF